MDKTIKTVLTGITSCLSALLGILYIPVLLLVACNVIDYATGLMAAPHREDGGISSYKSIKGIKKKVGTWLVVIVGAIVDNLLAYSMQSVGVQPPISFLIACVVSIWLICNEIISILENLNDIGVALPPFLLPIVKNIKKQTEEKSAIDNNENE